MSGLQTPTFDDEPYIAVDVVAMANVMAVHPGRTRKQQRRLALNLQVSRVVARSARIDTLVKLDNVAVRILQQAKPDHPAGRFAIVDGELLQLRSLKNTGGARALTTASKSSTQKPK